MCMCTYTHFDSLSQAYQRAIKSYFYCGYQLVIYVRLCMHEWTAGGSMTVLGFFLRLYRSTVRIYTLAAPPGTTRRFNFTKVGLGYLFQIRFSNENTFRIISSFFFRSCAVIPFSFYIYNRTIYYAGLVFAVGFFLLIIPRSNVRVRRVFCVHFAVWMKRFCLCIEWNVNAQTAELTFMFFFSFGFRLAATEHINDTGSHGNAVQRARDYSDWYLCRLRNLRCTKGEFIFDVIFLNYVCNEVTRWLRIIRNFIAFLCKHKLPRH